MFCDFKLKALTAFCAISNDWQALKNVRFEGDKAIACNGNILAMATFTKENEPCEDTDAPVHSDGTPFSVSAETIKKAFSRLPKSSKHAMPIEKGIFVSPGKVANIARKEDRFIIEEETDQTFPNYKQLLPISSPDDTVLSINKENMAVLSDTMKAGQYPVITLRIPQQFVSGFACSAFAFEMGDRNKSEITGLIAPCRTPDHLRNESGILIIQDDVSKLLALLRELAPENELVKYMAVKYPKLLAGE